MKEFNSTKTPIEWLLDAEVNYSGARCLLIVVNPLDWTKRSKISYIARMESERRFLHGNQEKIQQCNKAYGS